MPTEPSDEVSVRLRLIGQMEAWTTGNENILPRGRKARAVLAIVALSRSGPVPRGELTRLLWSRRDDKDAGNSLRREIRVLLARGPAMAEILSITREWIALKPGSVWLDVDSVMRASVRQPAALALLDGELLECLEGTDPAFDVWLTRERRRLRDHASSVAEAVMREQTDPDGRIIEARHVLRIDPAHESAWRTLMRAFADKNEIDLAIETFEQCRATLANIYNRSPASETQELAADIRNGTFHRD